MRKLRINILQATDRLALQHSHPPPLNYSRAPKFGPAVPLRYSVIALGAALAFPGVAYGQCVPSGPAPLTVSSAATSCTDASVARESTTTQAVVSVTGDGSYTAINGTLSSTTDHSSGVTVSGADATAWLNGTTVTTGGLAAVGLSASNGGAIHGTNLTITTTGDTPFQNGESHAVLADRGSTITLDGGQIRAEGESLAGLYAFDGGHITGTNLTITMTNYGGDAVFAGVSPGLVTLTGGSILALGDTAVGLRSQAGSLISATNVQIEMRGDDADGALAYQAGSRVVMNGGSVLTLGNGARGLRAHTSGLIEATDVQVTTLGDGSEGALAKVSGATINLLRGTITTSGSASHGVSALDTGVLNATGTVIVTSGAGAAGALSNAGTVTLQDVNITTTGNDGHGVRALNAGLLSATSTVVATSGTGAAGALSDAATVTLQNVAITTTGNDGYGVSAFNGGLLTATNTTAATAGTGAVGALSSGSTVTLQGGGFTTTGAAAHGLHAEEGGLLTATNTAVVTSGAGALGALSIAASANVTLQGGGITTTGSDAHGLGAQQSGLLTATGTVIVTSGAGAAGALSDAGTVTLQDVNITTTGNDGHGVSAFNGGLLTATNTTAATAGTGAVGALSDAATVELTGGSVTTSGSDSAGIRVVGAGTVTTQGGLVIETQGKSSSGVVVEGTGSVATLTNTAVSTLGDSAISLLAGGGAIVGTDLTIRAEGADAHGVLSQASGTVDLTRATITTTGNRSEGLYAYGVSRITGTDVVIVTEGNLADGANAFNGGEVHLTGGSVRIMGTEAAGLTATEGSQLTATNVRVDTLGNYSNGAFAQSRGTVTLAGGLISTSGESGHGLYAFGNGAIVAGNVPVITSGNKADGARATGTGSTVTLTGGTVTTSGSGSNGVSAFDTGILNATSATVTTSGTGSAGALSSAATVNLHGVGITTTGALAHGLSTQAGGLLTATNTTASVTGLDAAAVHIATGSAATPNLLTITGGSLASSQGPLILSEGGTGTISLNGPIAITSGIVGGEAALATVTAGPGGATPSNLTLNLTGLGDVLGTFRVTGASNISNTTFSATNWTGDLIAEPTNTPNTTLLSSRWTGQATNAANINIDGPSAWNVTGSSNATGTLSNAGLVQFVPLASGFSTLTTGSYVGQGGRIAFNTYLGADNSPTNLLVVNGGAASGTTALSVTNAGGAGELTVGDGIRLVQAVNGGSTQPGAFALSGRTAAGAYEYLLFRGGVSGTEDWFLRSTLIPTPVVPDPPTPTPPAPESVVPLYRPEVPLYTPIPAIGRQMGLATLGTLHERVGEEMNIPNQTASGKFGNGTWARLIGEGGNSSWSGTVDARARNASLIGIQAGFDVYRNLHDNGHRDHIGLYVAEISYRSSISGFALGQQNLPVGQLTLNGPSAGAYWTHFGPSGWYLDAVIQGNWFDAKATSFYNARMNTSGTGFTASLEGGYPIQLSKHWQIEPQAQIIYQTMSVNGSRDAFSTVSWNEGDAVTGRLGARLQYTVQDGETLWQPYLKANLWHGFGGTDRISFGASPAIENRFGNTLMEVGVGITARITQTTSLYGHVDHRWSVDGGEQRSSAQGAIGIRFNW